MGLRTPISGLSGHNLSEREPVAALFATICLNCAMLLIEGTAQ